MGSGAQELVAGCGLHAVFQRRYNLIAALGLERRRCCCLCVLDVVLFAWAVEVEHSTVARKLLLRTAGQLTGCRRCESV